MSISIYTSNSIDTLATAMVRSLKDNERDVFTAQYIITQTEGMNNWLKHQIAQELGIAANFKFVNPNTVIDEILKSLEGSKYNFKINRQHLDWLIFVILGEQNFQKRFPIQAAYYENDEMKQWEFAAKLSDLFDQYQIYRSEQVNQWNKIESVDVLSGDEQWQAYIWKALKAKTNNNIYDITEVKHFIIDKIKSKDAQEQLKKTFPELILFGLSIVTPVHLELFFELSQYINIKWYLSNPAPDDYWIEDQSEKNIFKQKTKGKNIHYLNQGNDLLTSWGTVVQQTFRMMFRSDVFINALEDLDSIVPDAQTLLGTVQQDIFYNNTNAPALSQQQLEDGSITVHDHYSIRREVEGVYNYIVDSVQSQGLGKISERDIVVMVTDVNAYAPFIRAVMDNAPYKFQYTIADESISNGDSIVSAFISLLEFNANIFSAEAVLKLLNSKYIRSKFGISNVSFLRDVIEKASIKFGYENDYENNVDDTYLVSWRYGLQKIMFGMCMDAEDKLHFDKDFYALDCADNAADMQELTALAAFVSALEKMTTLRSGQKSLQEWETYFENLLNEFVLGEEQDVEEEYVKLISKINQNDKIKNIDIELKVSFDLISKRFINALSNESKQKHFINKGITFCSPLPFRSIPFKIVAMLGLNHDKFPRREQHTDFDLITKQPQLGDRNIKNNDKHLFLESVLSASKALYLSYIGRSVKNNKMLPPSSLVDELLEYIQSGNSEIDVHKILVQQHPLQNYSFRYNKNNAHLTRNYLIQPAQKWPLLSLAQNTVESLTTFDITSIWKYFNKSVDYYYNNILKVYFERELNEIEDAESFDVDALQNHFLQNILLEAKINESEATTKSKLYLNAALPLKNVGATFFNNYEEKINRIYNIFDGGVKEVKHSAPINIQYQYRNFEFKGKLTNIINNQLFGIDWNGKERNKAKLLLEYLFVKAAEVPIEKAFVVGERGSENIIPLSTTNAKETLNRLLDFFIDNRQKPCVYSIYYYDSKSKMNKNDYINKLNKLLENQPYHKYLRHALQTLDKDTLDITFDGMSEIVNDIFLKGYEK